MLKLLGILALIWEVLLLQLWVYQKLEQQGQQGQQDAGTVVAVGAAEGTGELVCSMTLKVLGGALIVVGAAFGITLGAYFTNLLMDRTKSNSIGFIIDK